MSGKPIHEMTDAELDGVTDEQLLDLGADPAATNEGGEGEVAGEGEGEGAAAGEGEGEGEGAASGEGDGEGTSPQLTAEQLEELAREGTGMIPLPRLNEVLAKLDQRDEMLARQQQVIEQLMAERSGAAQQPAQQEQAPEPYDFRAANRRMIEAISEGDSDAAAAIAEEMEAKREEQRAADREAAEAAAVQRLRGEQARDSITAVMADVIKAFPFLDNNNKDVADARAITAINAEARRLVGEGTPPHEALRLAAEDLAPMFAARLGFKQDAGSRGSGNTSAEASKKPAPGTDPRTQQAIQRNLAIRQPQTGKTGVGNREAPTIIDIAKLSDAQLDALEKSGELDHLLNGTPRG